MSSRDPRQRDPLHVRWGALIRRKRIEACLTQAELAEAIVAASDDPHLTLDQSAVSRWESGLAAPKLRYRPLIAKALDTDHTLLFSDFQSAA